MSRKKHTQHFFSQSPCIKSFQSGKFCNIFKNLLPSTNLNWVQNTKKWLETWKASKWAMGTSGSFKIVLASYINSRRGQGKWVKTFFFAFRPIITPMRKNLRGIQGCHMKADVRPVLKMWCFFLAIIFLTRLMAAQSQRRNFEFVLKIMRCNKKKDTATIFRFDFCYE